VAWRGPNRDRPAVAIDRRVSHNALTRGRELTSFDSSYLHVGKVECKSKTLRVRPAAPVEASRGSSGRSLRGALFNSS
jgi:hypothetical protein